MGGSGGYRRLPGGSDHFSLQTHKQTLHHNIYIITWETQQQRDVQGRWRNLRRGPRQLECARRSKPCAKNANMEISFLAQNLLSNSLVNFLKSSVSPCQCRLPSPRKADGWKEICRKTNEQLGFVCSRSNSKQLAPDNSVNLALHRFENIRLRNQFWV